MEKVTSTGREITSTVAFIIYSVIMTGVFVWGTFFNDAPTDAFFPWFTAGAGAYWGKRLVQRSAKYGGGAPANADPNQPIGD